MAQVALPAPQARGVAYRVLIGPIAVALRSYAFPFFHACIWSFDPPTTYVEKPNSIETAFVWNLSLVSSATSLLIVVIDSTESKSKFYLDTMEQMLVPHHNATQASREAAAEAKGSLCPARRRCWRMAAWQGSDEHSHSSTQRR